MDPKDILIAVLPVFLLLVLGAVLRRVNVLRREHDEGIMHIVFHVLYPCFIFDKMLGSEAVRHFSVVSSCIGLGFGLLVVSIAIGWAGGKVIRLEKGSGLRTFALSSGVQNFGYTAVPVVAALWPKDDTMAVLFVHNLGVELAIWTVGVMLLSGESTIPWKKLINGPLIAVVGGLLMVGLHLDQYVAGGPVRKVISMLGAGAFPVAILLIGGVIFDLVKTERPSLRVAAGGSVLRLALIPVVILAAAKFLPLAVELKRVLVAQAAMPSALTPVLLAKLYGGRPGIAVQVIVVTTVLSIVTLPLIITWGLRWMGM